MSKNGFVPLDEGPIWHPDLPTPRLCDSAQIFSSLEGIWLWML